MIEHKRQDIMKRIMMIMIPVSFVAVLFLNPIPQDPEYHRFADDRLLWGVPNLWNVLTNLPFLLVGIIGIRFCYRTKLALARTSWAVFFVGVALVSFGSAYYHIDPNHTTLFWDRLPMTVAFMSLLIAILVEFIDPAYERVGLPLAISVGVAAILYWLVVDDLRFYAWVQFAPLACIPIILIVVRTPGANISYLFAGLALYFLAKVAEFYDHEIYALLDGALSGHSLKHVLAGTATLAIYVKLAKTNGAQK